MLTKLTLQNFQAHKTLEIKLDKKITCIIGSSDKGKSAVLRALRWLCFNKGSVKTYQRKGGKFVKVTLTVDKQKITRVKGKKNKYKINQHEFNAIGSDVPEPVAKLLNLNDINFQQQHDAPFWFSKTPGQVSKELNRIVNLELIDKSLAKIASRVREVKTRHEVTKERLVAARQRSKQLKWVKQLQSDWRQLQRITQHRDEIAMQAAKLAEVLAEAEMAVKVQAKAGIVLQLGRKWRALTEQRDGLAAKIERLQELVSQYQNEENRLCQIQQQLKETRKQLQKQRICPTCGQKIP